jgi:hypothetical protein
MLQATDFAPSTMFWCDFALKGTKHLSTQKLLCLGTKNVGEIDTR